MIRKLSLLVLAASLIVTACGRQVTPDRAGVGPGGLNAGFLQIKFRTAAPLDFTNVAYVITFNTTGSGGTPYARNGNVANNYLDYSYQIIVGGNGALAGPVLYQYVTPITGTGQTGPKQAQQVNGYFPSQLQFNANSNGLNTEFTITIDRSLFNGNYTPAPTATPTVSPSPTPTPVGATPSPTPSASPTTAPTPPPTFSNIWAWNFFTVAGGGTVDAFSVTGNGPIDTNFSRPFDITQTFDLPYNATSLPAITPASAQISGAEFVNAP